MTFIIGEAGSNHEGSLDRARSLIRIAVEAGCDAVKFQLIPPFQPDWIDKLITYCGDVIEFMATPFNQTGIDALKGKVKHWKIASTEAADREFVKSVLDAARANDTILISDGASDSLEWVINEDEHYRSPNVVRMACVVKYPPKEEDYHFYHYGRWGLSDHTEHMLLPVMAVAHGATYVEKHFTDDKMRVGPDHHYALNPEQLKYMVGAIRMTERVLENKKLTIKDYVGRKLQWP